MILQDIIQVKTNPSNFKHYKESGYQIKKCGEIIEIKVIDLPQSSHVKIRCKCEGCLKEMMVEYCNYTRQISNSNFYFCKKCWNKSLQNTLLKKHGVLNAQFLKCVRDKTQKTFEEKYGGRLMSSEIIKNKSINVIFEKYGVSNISKSNDIKEIKKNNSILKYGTNTPLQNDDIKKIIKEKRILNGDWSENIQDFRIYSSRVKYYTMKNKEKLYKNWDGYDYYDNEYIKDNLNFDKNHSNYPSIDHRISVLYGFLNKISIYDISSIENLCITKRYINSIKQSKIESDFKEIFDKKYNI